MASVTDITARNNYPGHSRSNAATICEMVTAAQLSNVLDSYSGRRGA